MPYVFKPRTRQVDRVAAVADALCRRGLTVTISSFYEASVNRAIDDFARNPDRFLQDYRAYLDLKT